MFSSLYIEGIKIQKDAGENDSYLFGLPIVKNLIRKEQLSFKNKVTFFVGENGTGKSTLLEAIAVSFGFNAEGGTRNFSFSTAETHSDLYRYLTVVKGVKRPKGGFFLRAESFYNVATEIDKLDQISPLIDCYGGKSLHKQSHGESFMIAAPILLIYDRSLDRIFPNQGSFLYMSILVVLTILACIFLLCLQKRPDSLSRVTAGLEKHFGKTEKSASRIKKFSGEVQSFLSHMALFLSGSKKYIFLSVLTTLLFLFTLFLFPVLLIQDLNPAVSATEIVLSQIVITFVMRDGRRVKELFRGEYAKATLYTYVYGYHMDLPVGGVEVRRAGIPAFALDGCDFRTNELVTIHDEDGSTEALVARMEALSVGRISVLSADSLSDCWIPFMGNRVKNVSFTLHHGEVLGIAGLVGAGRSELVETIFGIRKKSAGEILIGGKKVEISHPHQAIAYKIALVTEDRKLTGLNLSGTVTENITLAHLPVLFPNGLVNHREEHKIAERYIRQLDIKTPSPAQMVGNLSGGNQQKVVLAKWLLTEPDIIIMDEPTRGIDVGAKRDIYLLIGEMVKAGKAVIVISSEIPEVMRNPNVTEVPRLLRNTGHTLFSGRITLDESVPGSFAAERLADAGVRKVRTNEIHRIPPQPKVNGKSGLVLTVAGNGHILLRKCCSVFFYGVVPNSLLFPFGSPPADCKNLAPAVDVGHQPVQQCRCPAFQKDFPVFFVYRYQKVLRQSVTIRMGGVDEDQTAGIDGTVPRC